MKKERSRRRSTKQGRETLKEEDVSPSSSSQTVTTLPASSFITTSDEQTITSSTRSCDDRPSSPSSSPSTGKQKQAVDSPPDDVRAFFGHPLTRATSALNGEDIDTDANAEALLHEYINMSVMEREDVKTTEKLPGFLEIISGQRSDPSLNKAGTEVVLSPRLADSNVIGEEIINHDVVEQYGKELDEDIGQQGVALNITEYVNGLLPYSFSMETAAGQAEMQEDDSSVTVVSDTSNGRPPPRRKAVKIGQKSRIRKADTLRANKKAPRKPVTKSDAVSSTTNGPSKQEDALPTAREACRVPSYQESRAGRGHDYHPKVSVAETLGEAECSTTVVCTSVQPTYDHINTTSDSTNHVVVLSNRSSAVPLQELNHLTLPSSTQIQTHNHYQAHVYTVIATDSSNHTNIDISSSLSGHVTTAVPSPATMPSKSVTSSPPSTSPNIHIQKESLQSVPLAKEKDLKKVLSEKIRSRQTMEESLALLPAHNLHFITEDVTRIDLDVKYAPLATVKQEDQYIDSYGHQYVYDPELSSTMVSLDNCSALSMTPYPNGAPNVVSETLASCDDILMPSNTSSSVLNGIIHNSLRYIHSDSIDNAHLHQHSTTAQQHSNISSAINNHEIDDSLIVQSSQGQYFQVLQPVQSFESHSQVSSTNHTPGSIANASSNYYNNIYQRRPNAENMVDTDKQVVVERYLHQQHQYVYDGGYNHFLNPDSSYNMKSPDSGYQEPCLSPSSSVMAVKEIPVSASAEGKNEKPKKRKSLGEKEGTGESRSKLLIRQFSNSGSDKSGPRSPAIQKLDVNPTGYSYFLETPISTTQRKDEDRVTYLNKSQYYGLTLEYNSDRPVKSTVIKSVIILAFREEKAMEDERKAWEFWHGRQHSYKQRILDIDTKNCHGVSPQNIEEVAFNAVAIRWNPAEGPARVNVAVHCLSTDFSNQKGVKGIPLHLQVDTYEQSSKGNYLVHRGYCQVKAFCDKGAERKTRDEERRKVARGKVDEFGATPAGTKSRRKTEEAFHDPCDRSEFYSMADISTPPVFFNPLHESSEFIHKSLSIGVVPSQDEEISSLPSSLELPDSCDDYYINSPAKRSRRDSSSIPKDQPKVLLYVRDHHETVYTALMLEVPTLQGLLKSIEQKYAIAPYKVKNLYKKSRKGILVKLDDNIVRHYSHEATFIMETNLLNDSGEYEIILIEIDATLP